MLYLLKVLLTAKEYHQLWITSSNTCSYRGHFTSKAPLRSSADDCSLPSLKVDWQANEVMERWCVTQLISTIASCPLTRMSGGSSSLLGVLVKGGLTFSSDTCIYQGNKCPWLPLYGSNWAPGLRVFLWLLSKFSCALLSLLSKLSFSTCHSCLFSF